MTQKKQRRDKIGDSIESLADRKRPTLLREFLVYLSQNRKWWLVPFLLALALYGAILVLSMSGVLASIYTLF